MMTIDDVRERVNEIRKMAADDERAHIYEDRLREDVLQAIADGKCRDITGCAEEALTTRGISFARWCA
jgi:hypothetical protein